MRLKHVERLKKSISNYDWQGFLSNVIPRNNQNENVIPKNVLVNDMFSRFHNKILDLIDTHVPLRTHMVSSKNFRKEPWLTNGLCTSISKCKRLYKLSIQKKSSDTVNEEYKSCILEEMKVGNIVYDSATDIANNLGSYFASVSTRFANAIKPSNIKVSAYIRKIKHNPKSLLIPTTSTELSNLIGSLPNKSSSGFGQINNKLLKTIRVEIIFNQSLNSGTFPEMMKMAEVIPLYKGKCKLEPGNYRPISLLLTMSKILEKLLYKRTICISR